MSDRKSEIIKELESHIKEVGGLHYTKIAAVNDLANSAHRAQRALEKELEPPRIIRTLEELEALDPDTALMQHQKGYRDSYIDYQRMWVKECEIDSTYIFPLVVMMDGAQVRAAREALEQEHGL